MITKKTMETKHFEINYYCKNFTDKDEVCMLQIAQNLEDGWLRLTETYGVSFSDKKEVQIHRDLKQLHIAMGMPDAPGWAVGGYSYGKILTLSPLSQSTGYDNLVRSPLHEYAHLMIFKINPATPRWLNEGIAFYESKDHSKEWVQLAVEHGALSGEVPTLSYMDVGDDYRAFAARYGYQYMYTLVEFIIYKYGYEKLIALIKSPYDFERVFSLSQEELWDEWAEFLAENYSE